MEPVYGTAIAAARTMFRVQGLRFTMTGIENIPKTGGAVIAINHTSYIDFTFAGLPAFRQGLGRKVRFMAKQEVFDHPLGGPIMRGCRHIPVDRANGAASFELACQLLKEGELVGVYPEGTISRSFEIKEFKSGAARMAIAAGVPIVPHIVWGAQRIWTKGHPKHLGRTKTPVSIGVTEPLEATGSPDALTAKLHDVMVAKLNELQEEYADLYGPYPAGAYWVPARLGGGAPTLEEATALDDAEQAERMAKKAQREDDPDA